MVIVVVAVPNEIRLSCDMTEAVIRVYANYSEQISNHIVTTGSGETRSAGRRSPPGIVLIVVRESLTSKTGIVMGKS